MQAERGEWSTEAAAIADESKANGVDETNVQAGNPRVVHEAALAEGMEVDALWVFLDAPEGQEAQKGMPPDVEAAVLLSERDAAFESVVRARRAAVDKRLQKQVRMLRWAAAEMCGACPPSEAWRLWRGEREGVR